MHAQEVVTRCEALKKFWAPRNDKFKDWYSLIEMVDTLAQKDMESFVGNDPRASYNLLLSMLDQTIPHRIPPEDLAMEQVGPAANLSRTLEIAWQDIDKRYRRRGKYFLRELIGLLLSTGWYSVFATISLDGTRCIADIWNPASVYPAWDDELIECAHIFTANEGQAKRMIARNKWTAHPPQGKMDVYDYWWLDGVKVFNAIVLGNEIVKPETYESRFSRIPIFVSPVGGLPDTGELAPGRQTERWKKEIGQSVVATNENIYMYWNKWWTYSLQLLRDTAQARTYEKSRSGKQIVKPEDWYKRGGHFRMAPEDEIGFITPPPIPIEIRSAQLDMEAMMQRGGPSWAMFGNIQQQLTAYVMSQIAASANQITKPYHQGVIDCLSDIDNFWFELMVNYNYQPYGRGIPLGLPEPVTLTAQYEIRIPGDLIQRVTTARIMNPAFELSDEKVMEELFPEIKSPAEEMAKIRAGKARRHPVFTTIALIESFKEEARLLREVGDVDGAKLYEKAAAMAEATLSAQGPGADTGPPGYQPGAGMRPRGVRPEVLAPTGLVPGAEGE